MTLEDRPIISSTVRFLPMAIPCALTYPSKRCGTGKVKLYQFRSFDFDLVQLAHADHPLKFRTVMAEARSGIMNEG